MTAPKSSSSITALNEPKVKVEGVSKPKKHVTIKLEPQTINRSNSTGSSSSSIGSTNKKDGNNNSNVDKIPITPNEKILKQPNLKSIEDLNISKFYIQPQQQINNNDDDEDTPTKSTSSKKNDSKRINDVKTPSSHQPIKSKKARSFDQIEITPTNTVNPLKKSKPQPVILKKPSIFKPIEESIIENNNEIDGLKLIEIFSNIDDESIKQKYIESSSKNFENWSIQGFQLINYQYEIVKKIIQSRNKLNLKFQLIFGLINTYGNSLENEDLVLNEKMNKLQTLGEEIKNFIK